MSDDKDELRRLWNARKEQEKRIARDIAEKHMAEQRAQADRDAKMDKAFERGIEDMFGAHLHEIEEAFSRDDDADVRRVMGEYNKQMNRGNKDKAEKVLKNNKAVVKKSVAKNRKTNCLSVLVLLVGTAVTLVSAATWGAIEAFAAIVR